MPPLNAGAASGQIPGHGRGAPTATALAGVARHKLALHLPADATFRHELENKLHLQPFRGIVTGVDRGSDGRNSVHIQRTGQLHADPNLYPVFAAKLIPIVGDEVLLEYVAGSPTAMVTQARKGGRPDETDVPYSGASLRRYDSARALIRKHRDDHNSAHYRADGATVAHVTGENGDRSHIGDHYHSVGTLTEAAGKSGGYQRHTRQSGRYENRHHDGTTERIATHAEEVGGDHGLYFNGTMHINHTASGSGGKTRHKQHGSSSFHEYGDDGTGTVLSKHAGGNSILRHDGATLQHFATNKVAIQHDGTTLTLNSNSGGATLNPGITHDGSTHKIYAAGGTLAHQHYLSGLGGVHALTRAGGGSHSHGDDGSGNYQQVHGSGTVMLTHTNTSVTHRVSGSTVLTHDGTTLTHYAANKAAIIHDGTQIKLKSNSGGAILNEGIIHDGTNHTVYSANRGVIQHTGSGLGGQVKVSDSSGGQHLVRESTTGHLEHISTGGEMHLKTSGAGGNQHTLDGNQHKFPSTTKVQSLANDSSRIDVLSGTGGGAIKVASHSTTTIIDTFAGVSFPGGTGAAGLLFSRAGPSGTSLAGLIFKAQALQLYNGGNGNPQKYKVPAVGNGAASLGGTPVKTDSSGSEDSAHYWQVQNHYADGSLDVYGTNIGTGAPAYSVWATIQHIIVNA